MRRKSGKLIAVMLLALLLAGCGKEKTENAQAAAGAQGATSAAEAAAEATVATEETVPATVPADGNPNDVTCQGSYTVSESEAKAATDAVVATMGDVQLTNSELQVYYWLEVAAYRQAGYAVAPDFEQPLDTQVCEVDESVGSWQQYFLQRALNAWHSSQALMIQGEDEGIPLEDAYQPNLQNHETYLTDIPATKVLYGYNKSYSPNDLHQAYLDNIPAMLEEMAAEKGYASAAEMAQAVAGPGADADTLAAVAKVYNWGYMYYTTLRYYVEPTAEEVEAYYTEQEAAYQEAGITKDSGKYVDMRHLLLIPEGASVAADGTVTCSEEAWESCVAEANEMLENFLSKRDTSEARFAELANAESADEGSALNGGLYCDLTQGQLIPVLDEWYFDEARQNGDTAVLRTECGVHIVYFSDSTEIWYAEAEADLISQLSADLIATAREKYPVTINYSTICLGEAESADVSTSDILYPDVAHERYPSAQLYLQQDYIGTKYGSYSITTHGCGITTMAMLATYMTDEELTPPIMAARYASYCFSNGTDGTLFTKTPAEMGFFLQKQTYDWNEAKEASDAGQVVVVVQYKGYWTRGGHYLLLEKALGDNMLQIRDSNIYNYGRLTGHKSDAFAWSTVTPAGGSYWIYQPKIVEIPACVRCGDPAAEGVASGIFTQDYYCAKCDEALHRRNDYLLSAGE